MANLRSLPHLLTVSNKQIESINCTRLTAPSPVIVKPSTIHDQSQINKIIITSLVKEAKLLRDPCFEFLWQMQTTMQPFADTAGGQTTFLRSLKKKT